MWWFISEGWLEKRQRMSNFRMIPFCFHLDIPSAFHFSSMFVELSPTQTSWKRIGTTKILPIDIRHLKSLSSFQFLSTDSLVPYVTSLIKSLPNTSPPTTEKKHLAKILRAKPSTTQPSESHRHRRAANLPS